MDRRSFCARLPVVMSALGVAGCGGAAYLTPIVRAGSLAVPAPAVRNGALIAWPGSDRPLFVSRADDGAWRAVLTRCTHRGCQTEPEGDRLVCPCHGSEFARDGTLLEGPAREDLRRFPAVELDGQVVVDVSEGGA